jgi:hypothetical protein
MLTKDPVEKRKKWNSWAKFRSSPVSARYVNMNKQQFV